MRHTPSKAAKPGRVSRSSADPPAPMASIRTVVTRRGLRLLQHGTVLSVILNQPGPTHSVVDVMAAAAMGFSRSGALAMLGFAGGGMIGPLRAQGSAHHISAVDLSPVGFDAFNRVCGLWCGPVALHQAEARQWLSHQRRRFDVIVEDLSVPRNAEVITPASVYTSLPILIRHQLKPDGIAVFNLLHPEAASWNKAITRISSPFQQAHLVEFDTFENKLVLAGNYPQSARQISRRMNLQLQTLRSRLAHRISVQTIRTN